MALSELAERNCIRHASYPYGAGGPNGSFALITDNYMREFGARREDFGAICVAQRCNALSNPHALMKKPLTLEQYMAGRPISDPVTLFDCVMPCAGAEAFLVMREEHAQASGVTKRCAAAVRMQRTCAPRSCNRRMRSSDL